MVLRKGNPGHDFEWLAFTVTVLNVECFSPSSLCHTIGSVGKLNECCQGRRQGFSSGVSDEATDETQHYRVEKVEKVCLPLLPGLPVLPIDLRWLGHASRPLPVLTLPFQSCPKHALIVPWLCSNLVLALPSPSSPVLNLLCNPALYLQIGCPSRRPYTPIQLQSYPYTIVIAALTRQPRVRPNSPLHSVLS